VSTSVSSISFVITAIYTYTFANALLQILEFNAKAQNIQFRAGTNVETIVYALICMVMALRFFFGNNTYIDNIFSSPSSAVSRLYHFTVISLQSLILLGSSFLVVNPPKFALWIAALFFSELFWYLGCMLFLRKAILDDQGRLDKRLAKNEIANFVMAGAALAAFIITRVPQQALVYILAFVFVVNTIVDLQINMRKYMGLG
jgi:hypothetical protein